MMVPVLADCVGSVSLMVFDRSLRPFPRAEKYLSDRADEDLPCLALADRVTDLLGTVLEGVHLPVEADPGDFWKQKQAAMYLGILAARSLRAQMLLQRWAYDAEAYVFQRRLTEINGRMQRIVDPANGAQRAREWLKGRDRKPSAVADIPRWFWDGLSHVAHADYRAVEQHLVKPLEDGRNEFIVLPRRSIRGGNTALLHSASLALEVAAQIARLVGYETVDGLAQLSDDLDAAALEWMRDEPATVSDASL